MPIHHNPTLHEILDSAFQTTAEKIGAIVSVSMIASPWWITYLKPVSDVAALLAPILGCIWLLVQILYRLSKGDEK